jgi:Rrf2 family protein
MLTNKTKYALHALTYLAEAAGRGPVLIAELAREERIPKKFLERILLDLKTRGILRSQKGKGGGYLLARPAAQISLGDVLRFMDGPLAPVSCVSQTAYAPCRECSDEATCGIRSVMKEVRDAISDVVDATTLADLVQRSKAAQSARVETLSYEI